MTTPNHTAADSDDTTLYCTVHPQVETMLHCNRCGRPMCTKCAVQTPVGYRCKQCVRQQQDTFFDAQLLDYLIAGAVSLVLSFIAAAILARLGWFLLAFILSPAAGGIIGSVVWTITRKRRGRHTATVVGAGVVLGALPLLLTNVFAVGIYLFLATSTAVARFRLRL
ncbi:MAG: hypothetical protein K8S97_14255 [Anaerolineae bacterium]|nr:hypothetical protein [Anaerolineae bacterium]